MKKWLTWLGALSLLVMAAAPVKAETVTVDSVASQLICQCGCNMVLNNCTHSECGSRDTMLGMIKFQISQGQTGEAIIQSFVGQFGEKVLAEPPKRGFNLTAWLAPFVGLAAGAGVVYLLIRKWARRGREVIAEELPTEEVEAYQSRLERELEEFPERGFR
ncbi:MAG: cytochrome c-type biogenesis protein CcmH [Chloroflexi bacterium]|nr:cytochrome c-type biogenesis protein CcmH [Chloroflexota bacterium]